MLTFEGFRRKGPESIIRHLRPFKGWVASCRPALNANELYFGQFLCLKFRNYADAAVIRMINDTQLI